MNEETTARLKHEDVINYRLEPMEARVTVSFKKSSSKDGTEGFDIDVREGATGQEADRVMNMALRLRETALAALRGPTTEELLEQSIAALDANKEAAYDKAGI